MTTAGSAGSCLPILDPTSHAAALLRISQVACDLHESLCDVARKAAAANGLSERVSVVYRDIGLLQRGREVRPLGVNLVVADVFDAGGRRTRAGRGAAVLVCACWCGWVLAMKGVRPLRCGCVPGSPPRGVHISLAGAALQRVSRAI